MCVCVVVWVVAVNVMVVSVIFNGIMASSWCLGVRGSSFWTLAPCRRWTVSCVASWRMWMTSVRKPTSSTTFNVRMLNSYRTSTNSCRKEWVFFYLCVIIPLYFTCPFLCLYYLCAFLCTFLLGYNLNVFKSRVSWRLQLNLAPLVTTTNCRGSTTTVFSRFYFGPVIISSVVEKGTVLPIYLHHPKYGANIRK